MNKLQNSGQNILVVDDEAKNIQVIGTILEQKGFMFTFARSGSRALELIEQNPPDLILLDVMMPEMDGFETCEELKKIPQTKEIPVIFLTARVETEDIVKGFKLGAVDYVTKPFNITELLARVKTHLQLRASKREIAKQAKKLRRLNAELQNANFELKRLSQIDGLTALHNRRYFDEHLKLEWNRHCRSQSPLSLIMCDIDYFKKYNDTYGHHAGDDCLKKVAQAIQKNTRRSSDIAARFGGEEFVIVLSETDSDGALVVAESIRDDIERLNIPHSASLVKPVVSMSFGVAAMIPDREQTTEKIILHADKALYQSKEKGRDQISTT